MAKIDVSVIQALRQTADAILNGSAYQWGHMGACNCGNLAQIITNRKKAEIHSRAIYGNGDWTEQLRDYCPKSGLPMDVVIDELVDFGFSTNDLAHLEKLSDPKITALISNKKLKYNHRDDVVLYLRTWATLLEEKMLNTISIEHLINEKEVKY